MQITDIQDPVERFFAYARERHRIYVKRFVGREDPPYTADTALQMYSFTNIFRELDFATHWFRTNVRDNLRDDPHVLLATVLFRWFNRIEIGEAIFKQLLFGGNDTAWERRGKLQSKTDAYGWCRELLAVARPAGPPWVSGAYIIKGTDGMDKLEGVLDAFYRFLTSVQEVTFMKNKVQAHWQDVAGYLLLHRGQVTLESVWEWMRQHAYQGPFTSYEIICDLRYTALLDKAPDINTWANPGPGAMRGLARVFDRFVSNERRPSRLSSEGYVDKPTMLKEMREILALSRKPEYWPSDWPAWEMREVEHTLCEFDKWERYRLGQGRPRKTWTPKRATY